MVITLVEHPDHETFTVSWIPTIQDPDNTEPSQTTESTTRTITVSGLTLEKDYTIAIIANCNIGEGFASPPLELTVNIPDDGTSFSCLATDATAIPDCTEPPLTNLYIGDVVNIGGFDVTISDITSASGGQFSGTGYSPIAMLGGLPMSFEFENIAINGCYDVTAGEMNIPQNGNIDDIVAGFIGDFTLGEGDLLDNMTNALTLLQGRVEDMTSVQDYYDDVQAIADHIAEALPNIPFMPDNLITALTDAMSCMATVDPNITPSVPPAAPIEGTFEYCQANMNTAVTNLLNHVEFLYKADYQVPFYQAAVPNGTVTYGFDAQQYAVHQSNYDQIEAIANEPYSVAWKSVRTGQTDVVNAMKAGGTGIPDIVFKDIQEDTVEPVASPNPPLSNATHQQIQVTGGVHGTVQEIFAIQPVGENVHDHDEDDTTTDLAHFHIAGKLNVVSYDQKTLNVQLINVNSASITLASSDLEPYLDEVYSQAVVDVTVNPDIIDIQVPADDFNGILNEIETGFLSRYIEQEKEIIRYFKNNVSGHPVQNTYYIFLVEDAVQSGLKGHMPKAKGFGFVVAGNHSDNTDLSRTIAHELGHGAFTLEHTHEEYNNTELQNPSDSPNLMAYGSGTLLRKYQWDRVHKPGVHIGVFDEDSESLSVADKFHKDVFFAVRVANQPRASGNLQEAIDYSVYYCYQGEEVPHGIDFETLANNYVSLTSTDDIKYGTISHLEDCGNPTEINYYTQSGLFNSSDIFAFGPSENRPIYYDSEIDENDGSRYVPYHVRLKIVEIIEDSDGNETMGPIYYRKFKRVLNDATIPSTNKLSGSLLDNSYNFKLETKNYNQEELFTGKIKVSIELARGVAGSLPNIDDPEPESTEWTPAPDGKFLTINILQNNGTSPPPPPPPPTVETVECSDITLVYSINGGDDIEFPTDSRLEIPYGQPVLLSFKKPNNSGYYTLEEFSFASQSTTQELGNSINIPFNGGWNPGKSLLFDYGNRLNTCRVANEIYIQPNKGYHLGNQTEPANTSSTTTNNYIQNALTKVQEVSPEMYNFLSNNLQVNFNTNFNSGTGNTSSTFGDYANRLILKPSDINLVNGCPTGINAYYALISPEEKLAILNDIEDKNSTNHISLATETINKIAAYDANIGATLNNWIDLEDEEQIKVAKKDFYDYFNNKDLIYAISEANAAELIKWDDFVRIDINHNQFTIPGGNHAGIIASNSNLYHNHSDVPFGLYPGENPDPAEVLNWKTTWLNGHVGQYEQTIQRLYTKTVAHEMAHAYFCHQNTNKLEGFVWTFIEKNAQTADDKYPDNCYPAIGSTGGDVYCSDTKGHSTQDPDGQNACEEEHKDEYETPYVPPKPD